MFSLTLFFQSFWLYYKSVMGTEERVLARREKGGRASRPHFLAGAMSVERSGPPPLRSAMRGTLSPSGSENTGVPSRLACGWAQP